MAAIGTADFTRLLLERGGIDVVSTGATGAS